MAQQPNYGALSDYSVEQAKIDRARKYAELMQAQSQEPLQGQMAGQFYVAPSWTQGAAKMAQALSGAYVEKKADEDTKKLAERLKTERDQADNRVFAAASGSPNLATDPTRLATARPQWMTDAQPDLVPTPPSREEIRRNTLAAAMSHPDMRGPALAAFLQQQTANPESAFAKIDPSKFTADSVTKFAQSGNHAVLVPRDKMDFQNIGGSLVGLNPFTGAQGVNIATSMKPGEVASNQLGRDRLGWDQYQFGNLSENQRQSQANDRARLANQGIETQFNTGQGVGAPQFAGLPQNAPMQFTNTGGGAPAAPMPPQAPQQAPRPQMPQQPRMAPGGMQRPAPQGVMPGITPKQQSEINAEQAKAAITGTKDANSVLNLMDGAEAILDKAHGSGVGNLIGGAQNFLGINSEKNQADAQLKSLEGALVSKQPKMSGPQSDKDVLLYRQMAGQIGDATLPADVRKAAMETVRGIQRTYLDGYSAAGYQPGNQGYGGPDRRTSSGKIKRYNPATGMVE